MGEETWGMLQGTGGEADGGGGGFDHQHIFEVVERSVKELNLPNKE